MNDEKLIAALVRIELENAINCTGLGEVGCAGRKGWHTWTEHRTHVAEAQLAQLREMGAL